MILRTAPPRTAILSARTWRLAARRAWTELRAVGRDVNRLCIEFQLVTIVVFALLAGSLSQGDTVVTFIMIAITQLGVVSVAQTMISNRADGTALRLRCTPGGLAVYLVEKVLYVGAIGATVLTALLAIATAFTGMSLPGTAGRWLTLAWVTALSLAMMALTGAVLGAVLPDARESLGYSVLPIFGLAFFSSTTFELPLPGWVEPALDLFPFAWAADGLKHALLGTDAPLGGVALVLAAWIAISAVVAVPLLHRATVQASGSDLAGLQSKAESRG